jgi:hypothetical protein
MLGILMEKSLLTEYGFFISVQISKLVVAQHGLGMSG